MICPARLDLDGQGSVVTSGKLFPSRIVPVTPNWIVSLPLPAARVRRSLGIRRGDRVAQDTDAREVPDNLASRAGVSQSRLQSKIDGDNTKDDIREQTNRQGDTSRAKAEIRWR
jgi:bifunctional DNA-binding transcriptional regulator/antitoxin component of YhaV-PrlF toxin-antitoxin module